MAESSTAVALLFDDVELGGHLREALKERGARIVHEGALSTLSRAMLEDTGAQVLVVNLDEEADDELDRLYDVIDGDHPRVVFNDAQASRRLDGWDRARWARHLAVKALAQGDLDPPRPQDAPAVPETMELAMEPPPEPGSFPAFSVEEELPPPLPSEARHEPAAAVESGEISAASETLAAELEALLAADEPAPAEDDFGTLKFVAEDAAPPLHDGHFGVDTLDTQGPAPIEDEPPALPRAMPTFQLDHLALTPLQEATVSVVDDGGRDASALLGTASSWSLVDEEDTPAPAPAPAPAGKPAAFGIEKLSAAEFLAPEGGDEDESFLKPGMTLELVSIEEAIAPTPYEGGHEMLLSDLDAAISRVLVIGAAADSTDAVCAFLSLLPPDLRATVLHVQHLGGKSAEALAEVLAAHASLPVKVAAGEARTRMGEILVVPSGQQVRLQRDGRVELLALDGADGHGGSPIDASFTLAANVFGRNALAIVFAGQANDAVGGCQAIHDRGGQVWVETPADMHFADMVHGIEAERLHSYSGTPAELAARLVEEMSMEGRR